MKSFLISFWVNTHYATILMHLILNMYYNAIEVAMVVTDVGDVAGGALICAGSNSIIGAYTSEASG